MQPVRILIVGTGSMAARHAEAFMSEENVEIVATVDIDAERLTAFNEFYGIEKGFLSIQDAIEWGDFHAASNVTPDSIHYMTTMLLLAAGKHVLCEKPLATHLVHAIEMSESARHMGVVNMVNLSYRSVAAMQKAASLVRQGEIGSVRFFEASYLQSWLTQPAWGNWREESRWLWRLSTAHGSKGVLGDVGIHILDFTTFIAGENAVAVSCLLKNFEKEKGGQIGEYRLDANDTASMQLELTNGALGIVAATRFASGHLNDLRLRIYGDKGGLEVNFANNNSHLQACFVPNLEKAEWHAIECPEVLTNYQRFIAAIRGKDQGVPDFAHGASLQALLERAEESAQQDGKKLMV